MTRCKDVKSKLYSAKYGKEITDEQCEAVEYFAKEAALAYEAFAIQAHAISKDTYTPAIRKQTMKDIEKNKKNSLFSSGNLEQIVQNYKAELHDTKLQIANRQRRLDEGLRNLYINKAGLSKFGRM